MSQLKIESVTRGGFIVVYINGAPKYRFVTTAYVRLLDENGAGADILENTTDVGHRNMCTRVAEDIVRKNSGN